TQQRIDQVTTDEPRPAGDADASTFVDRAQLLHDVRRPPQHGAIVSHRGLNRPRVNPRRAPALSIAKMSDQISPIRLQSARPRGSNAGWRGVGFLRAGGGASAA